MVYEMRFPPKLDRFRRKMAEAERTIFCSVHIMWNCSSKISYIFCILNLISACEYRLPYENFICGSGTGSIYNSDIITSTVSTSTKLI